MPTLKFTSHTMPQTEQALRQALQKALTNRSPVEDFIQLIRDLKQLEIQHQMDSAVFFERFQRGEMGDDIVFIRWANKYEIYQESKAELENLFEMLTEYALPLAA